MMYNYLRYVLSVKAHIVNSKTDLSSPDQLKMLTMYLIKDVHLYCYEYD